MKMTSSPSPDDICEICSTTRENHGDRQHKFSEDGQLVPMPAGPPAKNEPPQLKGEPPKLSPPGVELAKDPVARLQLRMVERLTAKGIFTADDLLYLFGSNADS